MEKKPQIIIPIKKLNTKEINPENEVSTKSDKSASSMVYRNLSKEERIKVTKIAEEAAENFGVLINIIEK